MVDGCFALQIKGKDVVRICQKIQTCKRLWSAALDPRLPLFSASARLSWADSISPDSASSSGLISDASWSAAALFDTLR